MPGGKAIRAKGRRGETAAKLLLEGRDWIVHDLTSGVSSCDLVAVDSEGKTWAVEVKTSIAITGAHRKQAMAQAAKSRLPWMLLSSIYGTGCWLVQRQGMQPVVWRDEKAGML